MLTAENQLSLGVFFFFSVGESLHAFKDDVVWGECRCEFLLCFMTSFFPQNHCWKEQRDASALFSP